MLVSFCYGLLRWLLEFVALYPRSKDCKELEIIVLRHELCRSPAYHAPTADDRCRPPVPSRGEPVAATRALAILHCYAGDAAALASTLDRQAVDVRASRRSSADAT